MQITNKTANTHCSQYREDNLVCPPTLLPGIFTVAAVDNIDYNLSSNTAQVSFPGTAISLTKIHDGVLQNINSDLCTIFSNTASDLVLDIILPISYTEINPFILPSTNPDVPHVSVELGESFATCEEYEWLQSVSECFTSDKELRYLTCSISCRAGQTRILKYQFVSPVTTISPEC